MIYLCYYGRSIKVGQQLGIIQDSGSELLRLGSQQLLSRSLSSCSARAHTHTHTRTHTYTHVHTYTERRTHAHTYTEGGVILGFPYIVRCQGSL